jgi:hypothetical protein
VANESHPSSNSVIVLFVIGGVSLSEVKQIQELLDSDSGYGQTQVIIGSNNILSPSDLYQDILLM